MNNYSARLLLTGALLGLLVVSAAALAMAGAGPRRAEDGQITLLQPNGGPDALWAEPAEAAAALSSPAQPGRRGGASDGPFEVLLRAEEDAVRERLYLCDKDGCPLCAVEPDAEGSAALGPLSAGEYSLCAAGAVLGRFSLLGSGAVAGAEGLLWSDGTELHLTEKPTGEAVLRLTLPKPGYYSFALVDRCGRRRQQDLFIPNSEYPDRNGAYLRTLVFRGLPEDVYTAVYAKQPLAQFAVRADAPAEAELSVARK